MHLYICEKPSQAGDIAKHVGATKKSSGFYEGGNVRVTWGFGHLLECAPPEHYQADLKPWRLAVLPVIPNEWRMNIKKDKTGGAKKQFNCIKDCLKQATHVTIATDADREGEVIARELLDKCRYQGTVDRLWLSALDDASIKKALTHIQPGSDTESLYQAGLARQRSDWLVGMNFTMAVSVLFGNQGQGVLSVGRVQTPTLALVVERDLKIEQFKSNTYYECVADFQTNGETFKAKWIPGDDKLDSDEYCTSLAIIEAVLKSVNNGTAKVQSFDNKTKQSSPPLCLSLSTLQKLCSAKLGLSAKQALDIAQSLYETHKATSYPRTDTGYLPESQLSEVATILDGLKRIEPEFAPLIEQCDTNFKSLTWNDKKVTAHHGIIPTQNTKVDVSAMSQNERAVYSLIVQHYIAQFLGVYTYEHRQVILQVAEECFKSSSRQPLQLGWKQAISHGEDESDNHDEPQTTQLPLLKEGESLTVVSAKHELKETKPPARFTEGTLITAMKNIGRYVEEVQHKKVFKSISGIGTEATRANIIETLLSRGFLERKKKQLIFTEKGRHLVKLLPAMLTSPITTAEWESRLESIVSGDMSLEDFLKAQTLALNLILKSLKETSEKQLKKAVQTGNAHPCSNKECDGHLLKRAGKYGAYWACNAYPTCRIQAPDVNGKPGAPKSTSTTKES